MDWKNVLLKRVILSEARLLRLVEGPYVFLFPRWEAHCNLLSPTIRSSKYTALVSKTYYVYILQSSSRHALYIGVTNDLLRRVFEHKTGQCKGFTEKYKCRRLVYFEQFGRVHAALRREKQLKGWRREKKEALITKLNPHWEDLSKEWWSELQERWRHMEEMMGENRRSFDSAQRARLAQDDTS